MASVVKELVVGVEPTLFPRKEKVISNRPHEVATRLGQHGRVVYTGSLCTLWTWGGEIHPTPPILTFRDSL